MKKRDRGVYGWRGLQFSFLYLVVGSISTFCDLKPPQKNIAIWLYFVITYVNIMFPCFSPNYFLYRFNPLKLFPVQVQPSQTISCTGSTLYSIQYLKGGSDLDLRSILKLKYLIYSSTIPFEFSSE